MKRNTAKMAQSWKALAIFLFVIAALCGFAKETGGVIFFSVLALLVLYFKRNAEEPKQIELPANTPHLA